jgi:hypothetical protein
MAKKDPEKIIKDLQDYRVDGDAQRVLDEIDSVMEVESVDDNHATVKHAYLGFLPDDEGVDTLFQIDFIKDIIPWKKIRGLFCGSDEDSAQTIASNSRFEREFLEATAKLPADEDDIYSVVADPLLRKALKPDSS